MFEVDRTAPCSLTVLRSQRPAYVLVSPDGAVDPPNASHLSLALQPKPSRFAPVVVNIIGHDFCLSPGERTGVKAKDLYV